MRNIRLALALIITMTVMNINAQKPNIIFIMADDFGYENLTSDGGQSYQTPNLDAMATQGLRFTQVHSCPNCSPSRFELMTGVYNFRNYTKWGVMSTENKTFANVLRDAGYKTGIFGKWQLDGGDNSIHTLGFDDYVVYDPLRTTTDNEDSAEDGSRYKDPHLYANGNYLPPAQMKGKYGDDVMVDSLSAFIRKNRNKRFFAYYSMISPHAPFTPTPDDPEFSTWDPNLPGDTSMYPSMIKYLDKKVGQILKLVDRLGLANNTIIVFTGDNGTSSKIYSRFNGVKIKGGKGSTIEYGTHVPLLIKWKGHTPVGIDTSLIDFTDFYPTLADIAGTQHDPLDGISFYPQITGKTGELRSAIFCHFQKNPANNTPVHRWAQDRKFKLYDSTSPNAPYLFYDLIHNISETKPIPNSSLTGQKAKIRQQLLDVINKYPAEGMPLISLNPSLSSVTDSSVKLNDNIISNGGSAITASGAVWSINPDPRIPSSSHTSDGTTTGEFTTLAKGLHPNTTYYIRAYATNLAGTTYSNEMSFKTLLKAPVATKATGIDSNKFTANWNLYTGATSYRLDVSTSPTFTKLRPIIINEGFNSGINAPAGWSFNGNIMTDSSSFGKSFPSLKFVASNAQVVTKQFDGPVTELKFWVKGQNTDNLSSVLVEGFNGAKWTLIAKIANPSETGVIKTFNASSTPPLQQNFTQIRFTYMKSAGRILFDDVSIRYKKSVPFFVAGYDNLSVNNDSRAVSGLTPATTYYYRVHAKIKDDSTGNSNIITVSTKNEALTLNAGAAANSSMVNTKNNNYFNVQVFPNPSTTEFILTTQTNNNEKSEITVADIHGEIVYRSAGNSNGKYIFGRTFAPGAYFVSIKNATLNKTIKIIKLK